MEENNLPTFGKRLQSAMINAGFRSSRTPTGVSIQKLSEITENSLQICRKYLRDKAMPDIHTIVVIAKRLHVTPGWLLFGDENKNPSHSDDIVIDKSLLQYIFDRGTEIRVLFSSQQNLAAFLLNITIHISELDLDITKSQRIIDFLVEQHKSSRISPNR